MATPPRQSALRKGRVSVRQQAYLVTTVCRDRRPIFADPLAASAAIEVLCGDTCWPSAEPLAWILMPDHWHALLVLTDDEKLGAVVQRCKSLVTKAVKQLNTSAGPIWQRGFHDHALREEESVADVIRYLLANPVRAGLVEVWLQWPWHGGSHVERFDASTEL